MMMGSSTGKSRKLAFMAGAIAVPLTVAAGVVLTGGGESSSVATTKQAAPAAKPANQGSQNASEDTKDALAESKAHLKNCVERHMADSSPNLSREAKSALEETAIGRCSSQNNLQQALAIRSRSESSNGYRRMSSSESDELQQIEHQARKDLSKQDRELEYLKRGEQPDGDLPRSESKKSPAERRADLQKAKAQRLHAMSVQGHYAQCMTDSGASVASTYEYENKYVHSAHMQSRQELKKAQAANKMCLKKAKKLALIGPPARS